MEYRAFLNHSVGPRQTNDPEDVKSVQAMLNRHSFATRIKLTVDGHYGHQTERAIYQFQRTVLAAKLPDGIIPVWGPLLDRLMTPKVDVHIRKKASEHRSNPLADITEAEMQAAAIALSSPNSPCEVASIKAVSQVESRGSGFDSQGRPKILFERHIFSGLTNGHWDDSNPDISDPVSGGYSEGGTQYERLDEAEHLDPTAALKSASWGAFQIMGMNHKQAGFDTVQDFVKSMQTDVHAHLQAFVTFVKNDPVLLNSIQKKQWHAFALKYNGRVGKKGHYHVRDHYDKRLGEAYDAIVKAATPPPAAAASTPNPAPPIRIP